MQDLQQQQQQPPSAYQPPVLPGPPPPDLDLNEFESFLHKLMESCTKDSISVGVLVFTRASVQQPLPNTVGIQMFLQLLWNCLWILCFYILFTHWLTQSPTHSVTDTDSPTHSLCSYSLSLLLIWSTWLAKQMLVTMIVLYDFFLLQNGKNFIFNNAKSMQHAHHLAMYLHKRWMITAHLTHSSNRSIAIDSARLVNQPP